MKELPMWQDIDVFNINTEKRSAAGFPIDYKSGKKKTVSLNGVWKFKFFHTVNMVPDEWCSADYDTFSFDDMPVPSEWQIKGYDTPIYTNINYPTPISKINIPHIDDSKNPCGLYIKEFDVDDTDDNVFIRFGGINSCGAVYVNGSFVGYSQDTFDETEYDITRFVHAGTNRLSVMVVRYCDGSYLEDQDMWRLSGIFRDVNLVYCPTTYISDFYIRSTFESDFKSATFFIDTELTSRGKSIENGTVNVKLIDMDGKDFASLDFNVNFVDDNSSVVIKKTLNVSDFILWSHENPYLYTVRVTLTVDKKPVDVREHKYGFRDIRIAPYDSQTHKGPYILLNGVPLKICGVNRHDFHPDYGHAVPEEIIRSDLQLLKNSNITNVRTCHYPNSRRFYELCDEIGILVMSENNLETHGLAKQIPADSPKWSAQCCYRMSNMVNSFKNHCSIIFWSLGNESGNGTVFADMKRTALSIDNTRPIHYEPDAHLEVSDLFSEMYTVQTDMKNIGLNQPHTHSRALWNNGMGYRLTPEMYRDKPFILCEYSHAMGNSMGNFADYWNDFKKYDRLAGGYIWDFADQAIHTVNPDGSDKWNYGGDFGDKPNDGNFAFNGVFRGDRSPNPHYFEVVKCYQQVDMTLVGKRIEIKNRFMFTPLSEFTLHLSICDENGELESSNVKLPAVSFGEKAYVDLPFDIESKGEQLLNAELILNKNIMHLQAGHIMAKEQFILGKYDFSIAKEHRAALTLCETGDAYTVSGIGFSITFNKKSGELCSYILDRTECLKSGIRPCFGRANTDNERIAQIPFEWVRTLIGLNAFKSVSSSITPVSITAKQGKTAVKITVKWASRYIDNVETEYIIMPSGRVILTLKCRNVTPLDMPRYGVTFELPEGVDGITYYGKGPHENYCDRKTGAYIGKYSFKTSEDFIHDYLYPQENGNRCDVRYIEVGSDVKLRVDAVNKPFEASVHPYTLADCDEAKHSCDLRRRRNLTVNIDGAQHGVGGDVPAMATLKPQYKLPKFTPLKMTVALQFIKK